MQLEIVDKLSEVEERRRGVDMHVLTVKGLFKVRATKVLTRSFSTCIISKNLL